MWMLPLYLLVNLKYGDDDDDDQTQSVLSIADYTIFCDVLCAITQAQSYLLVPSDTFLVLYSSNCPPLIQIKIVSSANEQNKTIWAASSEKVL